MRRAQDGGNIDQSESEESLCARRMEGPQPQGLQSTRGDSSSESVSRIPLRIDLITAYWYTITHRQYSYNVLPQQGRRINHDRATSRQSPQFSRTIQLDNRIQPYSWPFEHNTRQLVKVIKMRRLHNQERNPLEDAQRAWDLDLYRHICNQREPIMHEVLQYLQKQVCCQANWIQSRTGQGNSVTSHIYLLITEDYKEDQKRASLISSCDSARLAKLEVVHRTERDYKTEDMLRREYASLTNGSETQKQRMGAATWIDLPFFSASKDGAKPFRQLLQARGLSSKAVDRVISNWPS
ncbi:MAG: hypothetical protein EZS28_001347 [Streblomastix strix]|uniref:Uncharacterized protein n=1 Tax=Streblomastix strix TaxID=222440 RepID=A0A5J4X7A7_9EUKA|nr:MAG: hypothetical protein EZS28_001347 [Streblomastix strix]